MAGKDIMAPVSRARSLLVKPVSGDCHLHCADCFYHDRPTDPYRQTPGRRMSAPVLEALIRQGMALDRRQATFGWQAANRPWPGWISSGRWWWRSNATAPPARW
jgi:sulfatase maturation enzyme AslB (radical SAM superfamily)